MVFLKSLFFGCHGSLFRRFASAVHYITYWWCSYRSSKHVWK